jgi:hypothetical protein
MKENGGMVTGDKEGSEDNANLRMLPLKLQQSSYSNRKLKSKKTIEGIPFVQFAITVSDFQQEWFHKSATRETAIKLLQGKEVGTFLVRSVIFLPEIPSEKTSITQKKKKNRPSSHRGCYVLSWVTEKQIQHDIIFGSCYGFSLSHNSKREEHHSSISSIIQKNRFLKKSLRVSDDQKELNDQILTTTRLVAVVFLF